MRRTTQVILLLALLPAGACQRDRPRGETPNERGPSPAATADPAAAARQQAGQLQPGGRGSETNSVPGAAEELLALPPRDARVGFSAARPVDSPPKSPPVLKAVWDFGTLSPGAEARHRFTITNRSAAPWKLLDVSRNCACTAGEFSRQTIGPSETSWVEAAYRAPEKEGTVNHSIVVSFAGPAAPTAHLEIRGQVRHLLSVAPRSLDFGRVAAGARPTREIELRNHGDDDLSISGIESPDWFQVEVLPVDVAGRKEGPRQAWKVVIRADPSRLKPGSEVSMLVIRTSSDRIGPVLVPASLHRKPLLEAVPDFLAFETVETGKTSQKKLLVELDPALTGLSEKDLVVTHDLGDEFEVQVSRTAVPQRFLLVGTFRPARSRGSVKGTLQIQARREGIAAVPVRVYATVP